MNQLEKELESYFTWKARASGMMAIKFTSPGLAGVPDRILITEGRVLFVELKAPGQKPRKLQNAVVSKMRAHGAKCYCISTVKQADQIIAELRSLQASSPAGYPNEEDYDPI